MCEYIRVPVLDKFVFFYLDCSKKSLKSAFQSQERQEGFSSRKTLEQRVAVQPLTITSQQ